MRFETFKKICPQNRLFTSNLPYISVKNECFFENFIKKTPNIDLLFFCSKTHLHVTFSHFLPLIFCKICPFLHTHILFPHFNNTPFPIDTPFLNFLSEKISHIVDGQQQKKTCFFQFEIFNFILDVTHCCRVNLY